MDPQHFLELVIRPALEKMSLPSKAAEELLLGTALQESRLRYLRQIRGPALGVFQVEPPTYRDYWDGYLSRNQRIARVVADHVGHEGPPDVDRVTWDLQFAAMMARVHYLRIREPLPAAGDRVAQGRYWKAYYNTELGRGTVAKFVASARPAELVLRNA